MKHLYVLTSWPEDMAVFKIKFLDCSVNLSQFMIAHNFTRKILLAGDIFLSNMGFKRRG